MLYNVYIYIPNIMRICFLPTYYLDSSFCVVELSISQIKNNKITDDSFNIMLVL